MSNPSPLQKVKKRKLVARLVVVTTRANGSMLRLAAEKISALARPRFSILVRSARKAKQEGMPNPNDIPRRRKINVSWAPLGLLTKTGKIELRAPIIIQKARKCDLFICKEKKEPAILEPIAAT